LSMVPSLIGRLSISRSLDENKSRDADLSIPIY